MADVVDVAGHRRADVLRHTDPVAADKAPGDDVNLGQRTALGHRVRGGTPRGSSRATRPISGAERALRKRRVRYSSPPCRRIVRTRSACAAVRLATSERLVQARLANDVWIEVPEVLRQPFLQARRSMRSDPDGSVTHEDSPLSGPVTIGL